ncbi:nascent polypeptide-associated complex subunit alpha-like protein 1 isoform X2 [Triticum aestivum]|uniref:nascent polypeptide-associated complex subunit alpha-like protein 1 isoform X2 n=1 Tax=Triticum aestivum TaxID=4565 RepID=UPI001D00CF51|nr:nascent polypeptide-associated complex subunit alpha-like protein 1 isoform X2 [Triticum aestivum]
MTATELLRAQLEEQSIEGDEPILEDDDDGDEYDDEDEDEIDDHDVEGDASGRSRQTRSEKKSRKAMEKLGMKVITGVNHVTIKKSKTVTFVLSKPDVFKISHSETYVIIGEIKFEDLNTELQTQATEHFKAPGPSRVNSKGEPSVAAIQDDEEVDETGVDKKDVELVMMQASVSRSRAVEALKAADGDIVSAIMELTN